MRSDTRRDRVWLWVASWVPYPVALRIRWRVQDHRLDRAMARRDAARVALRGPPRHQRRR